MAASNSIMTELRALDPVRHVAALFVPEPKRDAIAALYAYRAELARIPLLVSEPLPGEIRLQWWRDVVTHDRDGEAAGHPVGAGLLAAMAAHRLPIGPLAAMAEARITDLYHDAMPDMAALETYLGETESGVIQMAAMVLDADAAAGSADAAGHAGMAVGIAGLIERLPWQMRRGLCLLPADMLAAVGTDAAAILAGDAAGRGRALAALAASGRDHLAKARRHAAGLPKVLRPSFLPVCLAGRMFAAAERSGAEVFARPMTPSLFAAIWDMTRGAARGL
jgi:15-cis-phytoene synthase